MELPIDTILDTDPPDGKPLGEGALKLMKALYLRSSLGERLLGCGDGFTPTQIINELESLRRDGLLVVEVSGEPGAVKYRVVLTPTGAAAAWAAKFGGGA